MIQINDFLQINEKDIEFRFSRSGGPGGQNINKVETAVELRFNLNTDSCLPSEIKSRLIRLAGKRINHEGILVLTAQESRYQEENRRRVLDKLIELVRRATVRPQVRKKTKPSKASREKRLTRKIKDSRKKARRRKPERDWE